MILEYYIIAALSFAIMYTYSYGWEITQTVLDVLDMFDMDYRDEPESGWDPVAYVISSFVISLIAMPIFLWIVLFEKKYETIKNASGDILIKSFGFEKEKDKNDKEL